MCIDQRHATLANKTMWLLRRFVARLGKNAISVYEAPDMGLLDKKSIKLDAVQVCGSVLRVNKKCV